MNLAGYFKALIERVEQSDIDNAGKDANGFFLPKRTVLLRQLNLLKDLHAKPLARPMVRDAWKNVVRELPAEWLALTEQQKIELQKILED